MPVFIEQKAFAGLGAVETEPSHRGARVFGGIQVGLGVAAIASALYLNKTGHPVLAVFVGLGGLSWTAFGGYAVATGSTIPS